MRLTTEEAQEQIAELLTNDGSVEEFLFRPRKRIIGERNICGSR
jgi:hypothetical protein